MVDGVGSDHHPERRSLLVGRTRECEVIDTLLRDASRGSSGALVIAGPAGIGTSSLLRYSVDAANGFQVLHVTGVESEMAFGFAGVHQLVLPLVGKLDALPDPQRRALQSVLGTVGHEPPDTYLVALAVLTLVADASAERPVLVVVDDAQWIDDESATVLSFVARRLRTDNVAFVVALTTTPTSRVAFEDVRRLDLVGLDRADALELLTTVVGASDPDVCDRLVAAAEGNPLALVELGGALTADQLRGGAPLREPLPIGVRLSSVFEPRLRELGGGARRLLLLASAEREGDLRVLQRAATVLVPDRWEVVVDAAEASGLVAFTPNVRFLHPLVRSAVYYAATPFERRAAHAALADALGADGEIERRAWHLGAAAGEPDEGVALELEAASELLRRRGGASVAAEFLWRAAELSPDPTRATERILEAARTELTAGRSLRAEEMLDRATATRLDVRRQGDVAWTTALIHLAAGDVRRAGEELARALADVTVDDAEQALGVCVAAVAVALMGGHLLDDTTRVVIAEGTTHLCASPQLTEPLAQLVAGIATQLASGGRDAAGLLSAALAMTTRDPAQVQQAAGHHVHVVYLDLVLAAVAMLDDRCWNELVRAWVDLARRTGALAALPVVLGSQSWLEVLQGRPGTAASDLAEAEALVSLTRRRGLLGTPAAAQVMADAWQGNEEAVRVGARRLMQEGHERGDGMAIDQGYAALTVLEVGGGHYEAALRTAQRGAEHGSIGLGTVALADVVEAATRCGRTDVAEHAAAGLADRVGRSGTPWARGLLLRARALLAAGDDPGDLFGSSLEELSRTTLVPEQARTNLLLGEWLRRSRRRRDARGPLQDALETFEAIGAHRFAARAGAELAATGQHVRTRAERSTAALTPQEAQIARLAAAGMRNREIAADLYITTSTVEYHLRKVFVKLGVTSRTQLATVDLPS